MIYTTLKGVFYYFMVPNLLAKKNTFSYKNDICVFYNNFLF